MEEVLPPHAIFASNTSAIPIGKIAEGASRLGVRVIGWQSNSNLNPYFNSHSNPNSNPNRSQQVLDTHPPGLNRLILTLSLTLTLTLTPTLGLTVLLACITSLRFL
jgi:mannose/fructose/N-acetylgalactosamine-specific phosphotransferase system component IID